MQVFKDNERVIVAMMLVLVDCCANHYTLILKFTKKSGMRLVMLSKSL